MWHVVVSFDKASSTMQGVCPFSQPLATDAQEASLELPSAQKLSPTGIIYLGNYLEIGNAFPYRKNCFQELFGPIIVIESAMESLAGKVLFCLSEKLGKAPPLSAQLHSRDTFSGIIPVKKRSSDLDRQKKITVTGKIAARNYLAIRNTKPYRINCFQN